jgi:hypothetical protein
VQRLFVMVAATAATVAFTSHRERLLRFASAY